MKLLHILLVLVFLQSLDLSGSNVACDVATEIVCGVTVQDTITGMEPLSGIPNRFGGIDSLPTRWMSAVGTGDQLKIKYLGGYVELGIFEGTCQGLVRIFTTYGGNFSHTLSTDIGKSYYFAFSRTYYTTFSAEFSCGVAPVNDRCETAISLDLRSSDSIVVSQSTNFVTPDTSCGYIERGVWFEFVGNGVNLFIKNQGPRIRALLLEGDCENQICRLNASLSADRSSSILYAKPGIPYRLFVFNRYTEDTSVNLAVLSVNIAENDSCSNAIELQCDTTISLDHRTAIRDITSGLISLWYQYTFSTDRILTFRRTNEYFNAKVFSGTCANPNELHYVGSGSDYVSFFIPADSLYLFQIFIGDHNLTTDIEITCSDPLPNNLCSDATPIPINQPMLANTENSGISPTPPCIATHRKGLWYSFVGTGKFHVFSADFAHHSHRIQIFQGSCGSLNCVGDYILNQYNQVLFLSEENAQYVILITSAYNYTEGFIQFRMRTHDIAANDSCHQAIPVQPGISYLQDLTYSTEEPNSCTSNKGVWYKMNGNDSIIQINNLGSSHQVTIMRGDCAELECMTGNSNGSFDIYRFYAESYYEYFIHFQDVTYLNFSISLDTLSTSDHCEQALELSCGENYIANFSLASEQTIDQICHSSNDGFWYKYQGPEKYLEFTLTGPIDRTGLSIMDGNCDVSTATCLTSTTLDKNSSFFFRVESDESYWFHVNDRYGTNSEYNLFVDCHDTAVNSTCDQAISLPRDTTFTSLFQFSEPTNYQFQHCYVPNGKLWYSFVGDGLVKQSKVSNGTMYLLEGSCAGLTCIQSWTSSINLLTEVGKTYYILLASYDDLAFDFALQSFAPLSNNYWSNAEPLSCGFDQTVSFLGAINDSTACYHHQQHRGLWYTITGGDQLLSFTTQTTGPGYQMSIFQEMSNTLTCLSSRQVYAHSPAYFYGELDTTYLINISTYFPTVDSANVQIQCLDITENLICDRATPLVCDDTIFTTINDQYSEPNSCDIYGNDGGRWYSLLGSGEIINIKLLLGNEFILSIMKDDCKTGECVLYDWISNGDSILFHAEVGTEYFLRMDGYSSTNYEILVQCLPPPPGEGCTNAEILPYDQEISIDPTIYLPNITCSNYGTQYGFWYKFYSTHRTRTLLKMQGNSSAYVSVFKHSCEGECQGNLPYDHSLEGYTFDTEAATWYYVSISALHFVDSFEFMLTDIPGSYISPCLESHQISYTSLPNAIHSNGVIQASSSIISFATLLDGDANLTWQAQDSITLGSNFEVGTNAEFEIKIKDCQ